MNKLKIGDKGLKELMALEDQIKGAGPLAIGKPKITNKSLDTQEFLVEDEPKKLKNKKHKMNKSQIQKSFGNPKEALKILSKWVSDGDISSATDLLSAYVINSPMYKGNKKKFARAIGTTKNKLKKVLHHNKKSSMCVFFKAIEQIQKDISPKEKILKLKRPNMKHTAISNIKLTKLYRIALSEQQSRINGLGGAAITEYSCIRCDKADHWGTTNVPTFCEKCEKELIEQFQDENGPPENLVLKLIKLNSLTPSEIIEQLKSDFPEKEVFFEKIVRDMVLSTELNIDGNWKLNLNTNVKQIRELFDKCEGMIKNGKSSPAFRLLKSALNKELKTSNKHWELNLAIKRLNVNKYSVELLVELLRITEETGHQMSERSALLSNVKNKALQMNKKTIYNSLV